MLRLVAINKDDSLDSCIVMDTKKEQFREVGIISLLGDIKKGKIKVVNLEGGEFGKLKNSESSNSRIPRYISVGRSEDNKQGVLLVGDYRATILNTIEKNGKIIGYRVLNPVLDILSLGGEDAIRLGEFVGFSNAKVVSRGGVKYISAIKGELVGGSAGNNTDLEVFKWLVDSGEYKRVLDIISSDVTIRKRLIDEKLNYCAIGLTDTIKGMVRGNKIPVALFLMNSTESYVMSKPNVDIHELFIWLVTRGTYELVKKMVEMGYNINSTFVLKNCTSTGLNAIDALLANQIGNETCTEQVLIDGVNLLVNLGCKMYSSGSKGELALDIAIQLGMTDLALHLILLGVSDRNVLKNTVKLMEELRDCSELDEGRYEKEMARAIKTVYKLNLLDKDIPAVRTFKRAVKKMYTDGCGRKKNKLIQRRIIELVNYGATSGLIELINEQSALPLDDMVGVNYSLSNFKEVICELTTYGKTYDAITKKLLESIDYVMVGKPSYEMDVIFLDLVMCGKKDMCKLMLRKGFDINKRVNSEVDRVGLAVKNYGMLDVLVSILAFDDKTEDHVINSLALLIELGCTINSSPDRLAHSLVCAVGYGLSKLVKYLVSIGADETDILKDSLKRLNTWTIDGSKGLNREMVYNIFRALESSGILKRKSDKEILDFHAEWDNIKVKNRVYN